MAHDRKSHLCLNRESASQRHLSESLAVRAFAHGISVSGTFHSWEMVEIEAKFVESMCHQAFQRSMCDWCFWDLSADFYGILALSAWYRE